MCDLHPKVTCEREVAPIKLGSAQTIYSAFGEVRRPSRSASTKSRTGALSSSELVIAMIWKASVVRAAPPRPTPGRRP